MAIPIAITTVLCFCPFLEPKTKSTFVVISVLYVIWSMVYTVADVPYWGLSTCMTNDTVVRGKVLTFARLVCTLGAGLVTVGVPLITNAVTAKFKDAEGNVLPQYISQNAETLKWTYFICALVLVVVSVPMFYYGFKNTTERFTSKDAPPSLGHNLKLLFRRISNCFWLLFRVFSAAQEPFILIREDCISQNMFLITRDFSAL